VSDFAPHIGLVAKAVWGEPNARLSTRHDMRFGTNGSKSVDLRKGVWRDHETDEGGGVLDLLRITKGLTTAGAFKFLEELGVHMPRRDEPAPPPPRARIVAEYDYHDAQGNVVFQVVRMDPKDFRQRKPDRMGGWEWGAKGVPLVPYRLPELIDDLAAERRVFIVEGEKAVDYLRAHGIPATCNPMGAKKWRPDFGGYFKGADIIIAPDNDKAGREHGDLVAEALKGVAQKIRILDPQGPEKAGLDDWVAANSVEALEGMLKAAYEPGKAPFKSRYGALTLKDIRATRPAFKWVVKHVIPENSFGAINGQPACGKSFLSLDLAFHVAVLARMDPDTTWFGHRIQHGGVIYIAPEGQQGFIKRVHALLNHYKVPADIDFPFVLLPTAIDLRSADGDTGPLLQEIQAHVARFDVPLALTFIDTLNRAMAGGDENSSQDMGSFVSNAEKIRAATGGTVVPVHHKNAAGERERGHSSFRGAWDFGLMVDKDETGNTFKIAKQKDGEEGATFGFSLHSVTVGVDDDGDAITTCIVIPATHQNDAAGSGKKLTDSAVVAYRALVACCDEQGRGLPIQGVHASGVTTRQWSEWMRKNDVPDTTDEAHRKAMKRAMEALLLAGKVGVRDGYVWPIFKSRGS
jgi:hypothetical protein